MQENKQQNAILIIERLKKALKYSGDAQLYSVLDIKQSTLSAWKSRGIGDYDLIITFCNKNQLNLNYILLGQGEMLLSDDKKSNNKSDGDDYKDKYFKKLEELDVCKSKLLEMQTKLHETQISLLDMQYKYEGNEEVENKPSAPGKNAKSA